MYFSRFISPMSDGPEPRILVGGSPDGEWIDIRRSLALSLQRGGADAGRARAIAAALAPGSMSEAIAGGDAFLEAAGRALADESGDAVVQDPRLIGALDPSGYRDFMIFEGHFSFWYERHGKPVPPVLYELPVSYLGNPRSFIGPDDEVRWPHYTEHMDYELELGMVISRSGTNLVPEEAESYLFGFTILNDFSARDIQAREMEGRLGPSKGKHFACGVGPVIATPDEVDWRGGLGMRARLNGEILCDGSSDEAIWGLDEVIAWASQGETLQPGWLLGSGTCNGGSATEAGRQLVPGDQIELEIDGLGTLANRLGEPEHGWWPSARTEMSA